MGNYESARFDVWIERVVPDNDRDMDKAMIEMDKLLEDLVNAEAKEFGKEVD